MPAYVPPSHRTRGRPTIGSLTPLPDPWLSAPLIRYAPPILSGIEAVRARTPAHRLHTWLARVGLSDDDVAPLTKRVQNGRPLTRNDIITLPLLEHLLETSPDMGLGLRGSQLACSCLTSTSERRSRTCAADTNLGLSPRVDPGTWDETCSPAARTEDDPKPGPDRSCLCGEMFDSKEARDQHSKAKHSDDKNHGPTQTKLQ